MSTTEWFPATVNPVRPGVYQVDCRRGVVIWYAKWTGEHWCLTSDTAKRAKVQTRRSLDCRPGNTFQWRGLAKEPK